MMKTPNPASELAASSKLIDVRQLGNGNGKNVLLNLLQKPIEKTLSIDTINDLYARTTFVGVKESYFKICLDTLGANYQLADMDFDSIPESGPVVVTANHPFGGIEGIILGQIMLSKRKDIRILANYLLTYIPELREFIIPVDPFGRSSSVHKNASAFREAIRWLQDGGLVVTFPSGTVSHLNLFRREVSDPQWQPHIGGLIRHTRCTVLPVYFDGRNGALFQILGLLHPRLRTAMLARELLNKKQKTIQVKIGRPLQWNKIDRFEANSELVSFIRMNTYALKSRGIRKHNPNEKIEPVETIIPAVRRAILEKELQALATENLLVETDEFSVYVAKALEVPGILREIGRLREITFRGVREGTGKALDLDNFDQDYLHLFLWNKQNREIAGAYRLGIISDILKKAGAQGLYTNTLFHFKSGFLNFLENGIELGRSFIRESYQKKYNCLSLLWRGIGQVVVKNPEKNILFGPVSISQDYNTISKYLIIQFLKQNNFDFTLSRRVQARNPYRFDGKKSSLSQLRLKTGLGIDDVSVLVSEIEDDGKGIPTLLRYYLKLDARLLSFNVDPDFSDCVDGLIVVDLKSTDPRLLKRFMGSEGFEKFAARQFPAQNLN